MWVCAPPTPMTSAPPPSAHNPSHHRSGAPMNDPTSTTNFGSTDGVVRSSEQGGRSDALLPTPQVQNHAANLALLPDNSLGCVWFAGTQEGVPDISVWFSALDSGVWS